MFSPQQSQREIIKLKESEEKQRRAREAHEKAEAEKAARAARKRALVDMNAHETQEGVMDSLMEALQTGSAFSRPDQRRKRQTRVAGGKLSRTPYLGGSMTRRHQATRPYLFSNTLSKSVKLMRGYENVTPNEIAQRCNVLSNRTVADVHAAIDAKSFYTPDENQELYKRILIDEARKAPRQTKHLSRLTFFQKKRQCSRCSRAYHEMQDAMSNETPKRDAPEMLGNLEPRCINGNWVGSTPLLDADPRNACINLARVVSPVKQRRVVISKMQKRNNIVRRTMMNRKRLHRASNAHVKRHRSYSGMPPVANRSPALHANTPATIRTSCSSDGLRAKALKTASTPAKLLRSRNFENLTGLRDENHNMRDLRNDSFSSNLSVQLSSIEQVVKGQRSSPLTTEMSGIALLSENSPFHTTRRPFPRARNTDPSTSEEVFEKAANSSILFESALSILETSDSSARNKSKKSKHKSWKQKWMFWQTPVNTI